MSVVEIWWANHPLVLGPNGQREQAHRTRQIDKQHACAERALPLLRKPEFVYGQKPKFHHRRIDFLDTNFCIKMELHFRSEWIICVLCGLATGEFCAENMIQLIAANRADGSRSVEMHLQMPREN